MITPLSLLGDEFVGDPEKTPAIQTKVVAGKRYSTVPDPTWADCVDEGGWFGDDTVVSCCTDEQKEKIKSAYEDIINNRCLYNFTNAEDYGLLIDCISNVWVTMPISCRCEGGHKAGTTTKERIAICERTFEDDGELRATLLHEMVHACGGTELDAYAIEWLCLKDRGAKVPDQLVLDAILGDQYITYLEPGSRPGDYQSGWYQGYYIVWDSNSGSIYRRMPGQANSGRESYSQGEWEEWKRDTMSGGSGGGWF